jgi:diaminopimelate epimerase
MKESTRVIEAPVSHYSGCGNDFLILDDRTEWFPLNPTLIQDLCRQADLPDGFILLQTSKKADFKMRFFNNDGSEAAMCGNGIRSLMQFLKQKLHIPESTCTIETMHRTLDLTFVGTKIAVSMGEVIELGRNITLSFDNKEWVFHFFNSGVPHIVTFIEDIETLDVERIGAYFRNHERFGKEGTNVNFVDPNRLQIRTFERGVEGETLACGTGATASAYALFHIHQHPFPLSLQVRSQEFLDFDFVKPEHSKSTLKMTGGADWIKDGKIQISQDSHVRKIYFPVP